MKKLHQIALAAACTALTGQAFALNVAATTAIPASNQLYIAGSSALQTVIEGLLTQNCAAGTYTKYKGLAGSAAGTGDSTNGNSHNAYSCTLIAGSDFGATFSGTNIVIVKREAGGSAFGVFPLVTGAAQIAMLDLASCNDGDQTCNATVNKQPHAGVSDLEPVAFNYAVNKASAFSASAAVTSASFRSSFAVADQIFALVVNNNLYSALQAVQGTSGTPSVSSSAFASIFATGYDSGTLGWLPFGKSISTPTNQVNVCSRGIGSGTRATAQIQFLQLPYNPAAPAVAVPGDSTAGATRGGNTAGAKFYSEESSSGNVVSCVAAANAPGGYSIGIVGADRDLSGTGTHFVNLDNQVAGRATAKEGNYSWVFESFYQTARPLVASTSTTLLANAFGQAFKKPVNINAVSPTAANGVMATPLNCSGSTASDWVLAEELAACSRVSRSGDSRLPLTFIK